jgi:hypothetical protein
MFFPLHHTDGSIKRISCFVNIIQISKTPADYMRNAHKPFSRILHIMNYRAAEPRGIIPFPASIGRLAAGAVVPVNVRRYAQKHGLYVLEQSGESVALAEAPHGFKAAEW